MTEYFVPTGASETELVEKRSRFLGHVWPVESEEEARARIEEIRKKHYDARHHCWCYRIREGGVERYSDDGEPQGTATSTQRRTTEMPAASRASLADWV